MIDSLSTWAARFLLFFTRRPPSFGGELEVHIALAVTALDLLGIENRQAETRRGNAVSCFCEIRGLIRDIIYM